MAGRKRFFSFIAAAVVIAIMTFFGSAGAQALLQTGMEAPGFSLNDIAGNRTALSQFSQKKAVVLLFWASWSANSKKALSRFQKFHEKYSGRGIQIVGIDVDNQTISDKDIKKIKETIHETGVSYPVLIDRGLDTFRAYGVIAIPSTVIIMKGKISYEMPGLPLIGTEDMFDYLRVIAGEKPMKKPTPEYRAPFDAIADTSLAGKFVKQKMKAMAYPFYKKAIEKAPRYIRPYVGLAKLYESDGKMKEAETTLRKALSIDDGNVVVMSELGYLLTKTGRLKDALDILSKAEKKGSYTPSLYYYAYALGKAGKLKESVAAFDKALSLDPFEVKIYLLRAKVYEDEGMLKEASADYRKALELTLKIDPAIIGEAAHPGVKP